MQEMIHEYVRERVPSKGKTIVGVIVGTVVDGMIVTGFAKNNWKEGDIFDKEFGIGLALKRAKGEEDSPEIPVQMVNQYRTFQIRCLRYFKQATFVSTKGEYVPVGQDESKSNETDVLFTMIKDLTTVTELIKNNDYSSEAMEKIHEIMGRYGMDMNIEPYLLATLGF